MRDLFGDERVEIRAIAHALRFGLHGELGVQATDGRQMQALEHRVEIGRRGRG